MNPNKDGGGGPWSRVVLVKLVRKSWNRDIFHS